MTDCCIERGRFDHSLMCSPCQELVIFGWHPPPWAEWTGIAVFWAIVLALIVNVAGLAMGLWGND